MKRFPFLFHGFLISVVVSNVVLSEFHEDDGDDDVGRPIDFTAEIQLAPNSFITGERKIGYEQFLGIPYAQPPLGFLRFRVSKSTLIPLISTFIYSPSTIPGHSESETSSTVGGKSNCYNASGLLLAIRSPVGHASQWHRRLSLPERLPAIDP